MKHRLIIPFLFFGLLSLCFLSAYFQLLQNPSLAINKVNNWDFNGNSTGWTASNNGSGTDVCGSTTSTVGDTAYTSFAYSGGYFQALTPATRGIFNRGMISQTFTAPDSGSVYVKGRFDYYGNGTNWGLPNSSWIRLDIYDSTNTTHIGSLSCISFASNQSWTNSSFGSNVTLTGGTTYTIRVTLRASTKSNKDTNITLGVDNIIVNLAPTGLTASAPVSTTNAQLNWTASVGGSGAPTLHGSTPYKVYRNAASPVSTFLADAATNFYTDSSTAGNTTYFYAISDFDVNSIESPLSAEASILTRPAVPGTPTFTNVQTNSLTVNWASPAGGAASYKVERCSGPTCSDFGQIAAGITSNTYPDTDLIAETLYRYQIRATNVTGDGNYSGIGETTTTAAVAVSISLVSPTTSGSLAFTTLALGSTKNTTGSGINDTEIISVDSGPANLDIKSTHFTEGGNTWFLGLGAGTTQVQWQFSKNAGVGWTAFVVADTLYGFDTNVAQGDTRPVDFELTMPTSTDSYNQYGATITIQASAP